MSSRRGAGFPVRCRGPGATVVRRTSLAAWREGQPCPGPLSPENILTRLLFPEQNLERQVLQTQCRRLEAQHYSLSLTAEQLSHSMAVSPGPHAPGRGLESSRGAGWSSYPVLCFTFQACVQRTPEWGGMLRCRLQLGAVGEGRGGSARRCSKL